MVSSGYLSDPVVQYLSQLLDEIRSGNLLVPRFQRPFVWKDTQRLDLLRSIQEGIPIGSILVWRTAQHELATFSRIGGHPVPKRDNTSAFSRSYLLDGHQRLSTLFGALESVAEQKGSLKPAVEDEDGVNWHIYYDLSVCDFVLPANGRHTIPPTWMPTNVILDSRRRLRFQRALSLLQPGKLSAGSLSHIVDPVQEESSLSEVVDQLVERVDQVANAFREYKIPVIPIYSDKLDRVTTAFQRINRGGQKLDDVHMVAALSYGQNFDLSEKLAQAGKQSLSEVGWDSFEEKYILAVIRAALDLKIVTPDAQRLSEKIQESPILIDEAVANIMDVASFLGKQCGISTPNLVPYSYHSIPWFLDFDSNGLFFIMPPFYALG